MATVKRKLAKSAKKPDVNLSHKAGDLVAVVRYARVRAVGPTDLEVKDVDNGTEFYIRGKTLVDDISSAHVYNTVETVPLTKAAELVSSAFNSPISVCFEKQDGTERVLIGRLKTPEPLLGRSYFDDLEIETGHRLRQVDHRTIKWAVINRVKYVVK